MSVIDKLHNFGVKIQPFLDKFGAYSVYLCSAVTGRLTNNNEPIVNIEIERELYFIDGKVRKDKTRTDSYGNFNFPQYQINSDQPGIPFTEIRTIQVIKTVYSDSELILWKATLVGTEPQKEYAIKLNSLNCDVNNEELYFSFKSEKGEEYKFYASSIARWKDNYEIVDLDNFFNT